MFWAGFFHWQRIENCLYLSRLKAAKIANFGRNLLSGPGLGWKGGFVFNHLLISIQ